MGSQGSEKSDEKKSDESGEDSPSEPMDDDKNGLGRDIDERFLVVIVVLLLAIPAALIALHRYYSVSPRVMRGSILFIPLALFFYWYATRSEGNASRTDVQSDRSLAFTEEIDREEPGDSDGESEEAHPNANAPSVDAELLSVNYEMISQQAMYRDQLLIRANYFSIAVLAVLVNIFLRTDPHLRPAVAMIGVTTAFAFWLATESYKGTRDELNDELGNIEKACREFTAVQTYDRRDRSPVGKRSLSSYFVGLQIAATILWLIVYTGYSLYLL